MGKVFLKKKKTKKTAKGRKREGKEGKILGRKDENWKEERKEGNKKWVFDENTPLSASSAHRIEDRLIL